MSRLIAGAVLLAFFVIGGLWVGTAGLIPADIPYARSIAVIGFGLAFSGMFLWFLISRVQNLLVARGKLWREALLVLANLVLMLLAYAFIYSRVGIVDATGSTPTTTRDFATCAYFSIITFTTVGYGDFRPDDTIARTMAGLQGLLGYLVLGLLASTAGAVLQRRGAQRG